MKYRRLRLSFELLRSWLGTGAQHKYEVIEGIPQDAKLVNVQHAWPNWVEVLIESETFEPVKDGEFIPEMSVTVKGFQFAEPQSLAS